jgi:hypothetical protein
MGLVEEFGQVALLLMSWSANNNSKDAIYWSGVAINQARLLNLHKDEMGISTNSSDAKLRCRLWWLVLMKKSRRLALFECSATDLIDPNPMISWVAGIESVHVPLALAENVLPPMPIQIPTRSLFCPKKLVRKPRKGSSLMSCRQGSQLMTPTPPPVSAPRHRHHRYQGAATGFSTTGMISGPSKCWPNQIGMITE